MIMKQNKEKFDFKAFGQAIKAARKAKGISRNQLADTLNIAPRYIASIENSGQHPSLQILYELVTLLDVSVDQFFFPEREQEKSTRRRQLDTMLDTMSENSIKAQESRGYEQWAKIHNLKLAAKTMNFLTEHQIEQYADLISRIEEINAENEKTADALKSVEKRLADMAVLMKHVATYQKTKPVYEAYRRAKDKDAYRAKNESSLILHEAAAKALKASGITKFPNLAAMQEEYGKLQAQKEAFYSDYGKLKKKVKEYDVIKQNIDSILRQPREPEREKGKERE